MTWDKHISIRLFDFACEEEGAITVDWVVLTAAVIGLVIAVTVSLGNGAVDHAERIDDKFVETGVPGY